MSQEAKETRPLSPTDVHYRIGDLERANRLDEALELVDPDVIEHLGSTIGDRRGIAALKERWDHLFDNRLNFSFTVEEHVASGELSASVVTVRAVDKATGIPYEILCMDMMRVRNGKLVEHWVIPDHDAKRHQLGLSR